MVYSVGVSPEFLDLPLVLNATLLLPRSCCKSCHLCSADLSLISNTPAGLLDPAVLGGKPWPVYIPPVLRNDVGLIRPSALVLFCPYNWAVSEGQDRYPSC